MTADMIASSYRAFCKVCTLVVELIRQFYTVPRCFKVISPNKGAGDYMVYDNASLKAICSDADGTVTRIPAFDISISAEKGVKSKREELNAMAKELYSMGVFDPSNRESAMVLLGMMEFEGRDELISRLSESEDTL